jgi:hypothetical protein
MVVHCAESGRGCKYGTGTVSVWGNHSHINALFPMWIVKRYSGIPDRVTSAGAVDRAASAGQPGKLRSRRKQAWWTVSDGGAGSWTTGGTGAWDWRRRRLRPKARPPRAPS